MRFLLLIISCFWLPIAAARAEPLSYNIDYAHSEVRFGWEHWGLSTQHAEFMHFAGELVLDHDEIAASHVNAAIDMTSLNTGNALLDQHLRTEEWFDVTHHPEARFVSTAVRRTGLRTAQVDGNLTIRGVTKPVTLEATLIYDGPHPLLGVIGMPNGVTAVGLTAHTTVLRSDFGIHDSLPWVSDAVDIDMTMEAIHGARP
jgi:polyisoprenoid-binding protein YceI